MKKIIVPVFVLIMFSFLCISSHGFSIASFTDVENYLPQYENGMLDE